MCVREREDIVLRETLGNHPQMHVVFLSYKAMDDCHGIVIGALASQ